MSIRVLSLVWDHSAHKSGALLTLLAIADFADDEGVAFPSIEVLARKARLQPRMVHYVLKTLVASKELLIESRQGRSSLYRIPLGKWTPANIADPTPAKTAPLQNLHPLPEPVESAPVPDTPANIALLEKHHTPANIADTPAIHCTQIRHLTRSTPKARGRQQRKLETVFSPGFLAFWALYPKKLDKQSAWRAWVALGLEPMADQLVASVHHHLAHDPQWRDGFIKHPATYLNAGCWDDEFDPVARQPNGTCKHPLWELNGKLVQCQTCGKEAR